MAENETIGLCKFNAVKFDVSTWTDQKVNANDNARLTLKLSIHLCVRVRASTALALYPLINSVLF